MGRKILFITTDQQRYDTLGVNGGELRERRCWIDLRARAFATNDVSRRGRLHALARVDADGAVPLDARRVDERRRTCDRRTLCRGDVCTTSGYATALIGKAHFEPFMDPFGRFAENSLASLGIPTIEQPWFDGRRGVHRGFDYLEFATHGVMGPLHYAKWMRTQHPEALAGFYPVVDGDLNVNAAGGGDTGAVQVKLNDVPREWYHTEWVADRTIEWLSAQSDDADWFCWMSFPDPHHPWDPPASERHRVNWRDVALPANYPETPTLRESLLDQKARHWRAWYDGRVVSNYEAPAKWVPATMTADQVREVNALNAIEVELIDEAIGRVLNMSSIRVGTMTSTSSSPVITANSRATSASCSRVPTTWTR